MKQKSIQDRIVDEIVFSSIDSMLDDSGIQINFSDEIQAKISQTTQRILKSILDSESIEKLQKKGIIY